MGMPRRSWPNTNQFCQFPRVLFPFILNKRIEAGRGQKELMTPKVKENKEFARWLRDWIKVIQRNPAPVEHTPPEKTASADGQEHSDDAHLSGPRRRAASGRYVA